MSRLKLHYEHIVRNDWVLKYPMVKVNDIPKLESITVHMSVKQAVLDKKHILPALLALELITGQKAIVSKAKQSNASFKLKEGMIIGCKSTLRSENMYEFLDKLINIVLPRLRDFDGLNQNSFDGNGNYSFGIKDFIVFPEIENEYDKFDRSYGMDITINTSASTDMEAKVLLSAFQVPFKVK